jgi:integrase
MASLTITTRETASGPRYVVRFRLGGRAYPVEHAGSFKTLREAKARRHLVAGELSAGRNPREALRALREQPRRRTLRDVAEAYSASRLDAAEQTRRAIRNALGRILPDLGDLEPDMITVADVQEWVGTHAVTLRPNTMRAYAGVLKMLLDFAGCTPNVARDRRVRLPRVNSEPVQPPSAREVQAMRENIADRYKLPFDLIEATGMRTQDVLSVAWQDVDFMNGRLRIRSGKTRAARRWVQVPEDLMARVDALCPNDDRASERRLFRDLGPSTLRNAMERACKSAGIAVYSPHDLRHRYISLQVKRGVPITDIAAQVGHTRKSLTLDTYSHVLLDEGS